ncbi:general secretion pathway protein D [Cystobacter fuscus DSM 2262]|uniref:General secretion pathway protein D n=1 Tax=Cystobacter fuscus (strain ATCC 25194 / DSM 2262 / NBRC 100088 / M29) TaxID=1242864 RepID=S9P2B8_CYSF2|nr:type II secretion system secretin GspD [Cystobacter fuscus]EPX58585.1 general secretion pathway protein D [Cystobacter fuscus DSM 2262]
MKTLPSWLLLLSLATASPALAQRPTTPADRQITPQGTNPEGNGTTVRPTPTCEEVRRRARYNIYFDKVDIEKLVQTVSDATCRTFILPENVRGKISIIGPENGRVEVDADQFYAAFLAALDANGLSVYQHGRFLKIVDKRAAKQNPIPTLMDDEGGYTGNEQMITKLFRIKNVEVEPLRGVLQQLVSKDGDTIPYPPDIVIINDVGSNVRRLERIIDQLDTRSASDEVRIIQVQYATAQDVAATVQKLFEQKGGNPNPGMPQGRTPRGAPAVMTPPGGSMGETMPPSGAGGDSASGPVTFSQMIPDERTNKLIVVASPAAFERIQSLVRELDIPTAGTERINVYPLENANAEELASTLQTLSQGTGNRPRSPVPVPGAPGMPRQPGSGGAAELFSGEVKISADKGTNSLVIIASQSDYRSLVRVIRELDKPRRQVFVEAVIMEVNLDRKQDFGLNVHSGYQLPMPGNLGTGTGLVGTKYSTTGLPPSFSLANLAGFGGFLAGLQGPVIPELKALGLDIPAFGIVLHAFQQSSDVNVLSTPHLLTSDNEEAEITVGQNVPFQSGFSPQSLGTTGTPGTTGGVNSLLGSLGGLSSLYAPITRQNVELKLTIKPQINESDFIRMAITEQTEEIASTDAVLGPTTSKRSAKTTVVAKDQETVVIGGIMQERTIETVAKVPILGDVPLLGHLFRSTNKSKTKTNLLLFLTPYIIREQSDFRRIFERKMAERQQFVEQFYGQVAGYDVPVDFTRKSGPLGRMRRTVLTEEQKAENGGPGMAGERILRPASGTPAPSPGAAPAPTPGASSVAPGEVSPGAGGLQTPSATEAPEVQPPSAPPPEDPERLRLQPDTGNQE